MLTCVGAIVTLMYVYGVALRAPSVGSFHDDGVYLVTAKALAEGQGYRINSLPTAPPQTKYPIVFPWLLSWIWRIYPSFPSNLWALRTLPFAAALGWLGASWALATRAGMSKAGAMALGLMAAASPQTVFLATSLMSETLFALFMTATLLAVHTAVDRHGGAWRMWLGGALAGLSFLTRATGLAVIVAGVLYLSLCRRWRDTGRFTAAALIVAAPWLTWVFVQSASVSSSDAFYAATNYTSWNVLTSYTLREKALILLTNTGWLVLAPSQMLGIDSSPASGVLSLCMVLLCARGLWIRRSHVIATFVIVYLALVWGWAWPPLRFLVPIGPLLGWIVWSALPAGRVWLHAIVAVSVALAMVPGLARMPGLIRDHGAAWPTAPTNDRWVHMAPLLNWVREQTPPASIVAGNLDPMLFLYTGRRAVRAFRTDAYSLYYDRGSSQPIGTVETLRQQVLTHRVDFLVVTPDEGFGESPYFKALVDELARSRPGSLTVATGDPARTHVVYRVDRSRLEEARGTS